MFVKLQNSRWMLVVTLALVLGLLLPMSFAPAKVANAKDGDVATYGYIKVRPAGKIGTWTLNTKAGTKSFTAISATQLQTLAGPLVVGACAKVKQRLNSAGRLYVHEISSEPARDCLRK